MAKSDAATEIALDVCEAVADISITLVDRWRMGQSQLGYICLGDDEYGDFLSLGETPT